MEGNSTRDSIINHRRAVQRWMQQFAITLLRRAENHDNSKLKSPEFELWEQMDSEPKYAYGTKEYFEKMDRYRPLFELHWKNNRHHPEHFERSYDDIDLIDILEMICDWLSYKDNLTYTQASELVSMQCERYNFSEELRELILNTLKNHFIYFGGVFPPIEGPEEIPHFEDYEPKIDIMV